MLLSKSILKKRIFPRKYWLKTLKYECSNNTSKIDTNLWESKLEVVDWLQAEQKTTVAKHVRRRPIHCIHITLFAAMCSEIIFFTSLIKQKVTK